MGSDETAGRERHAVRRIFIARSFDELGERIFEHVLAPALRAAALEPIHVGHCDSDIAINRVCAAVERCDGMVAVLAGRNRNVYIEAGIASALRKPMLLLAGAMAECGMLAEKYPVVLLGDRAALERELSALKHALANGAARSADPRRFSPET